MSSSQMGQGSKEKNVRGFSSPLGRKTIKNSCSSYVWACFMAHRHAVAFLVSGFESIPLRVERVNKETFMLNQDKFLQQSLPDSFILMGHVGLESM